MRGSSYHGGMGVSLLEDRIYEGRIEKSGYMFSWELRQGTKLIFQGLSYTEQMAKITAEAFINNRKMNEVIIWEESSV